MQVCERFAGDSCGCDSEGEADTLMLKDFAQAEQHLLALLVDLNDAGRHISVNEIIGQDDNIHTIGKNL